MYNFFTLDSLCIIVITILNSKKIKEELGYANRQKDSLKIKETKKPTGLSVISCFWIALGLSIFIEIIYYTIMPIGRVLPPELSTYSPLIGLLFISIGKSLRKYQIWARFTAIILSVIAAIVILFNLLCRQIANLTLFHTFLVYSVMIILLFIYVFNIYYLTRPKIKELFVKTKVGRS